MTKEQVKTAAHMLSHLERIEYGRVYQIVIERLHRLVPRRRKRGQGQVLLRRSSHFQLTSDC